MKKLISIVAFASSALAGVAAHAGEIALFTDDNFRGPSITLRDSVPDLVRRGFNDRASSVVVRSGTWELCEHANFGGQCRVLERGEYRRLEGFNDEVSSVREIQDRGGDRGRDRGDRNGWGGGGRGDRRDESVTMFEQADFRGRQVELNRDIRTLNDVGFNDRAGSIIVRDGVWEACEDADYRGRCMTLRPGRYDHLDRMNNNISSLRRVR
ncbi:MAG: beta/gamma crystallin family protein [Duganella sp.]